MLDQQQACCSWSLPKNNLLALFYAATERVVTYDALVRPLRGKMEERLSMGVSTDGSRSYMQYTLHQVGGLTNKPTLL